MSEGTPRPSEGRSFRVAVFASGGGRSFENLVERSRRTQAPYEVSLLVSNRRSAPVLERSRRLGVPARVIRPRDYSDEEAFGRAVTRSLDEAGVDAAVLAGYLVRLPVAPHWRGRILNIHPALLPAFGGKGFYGRRVHEAVHAAGVKVTGCTVHFVDDEYDSGPIVLQRVVPVRFEDGVDDIADRVFEQEKEALPEAVALLAEGRLRIEGRRVRILERTER